ncbi:MAG: ZIP family metal transporter [Gammaproteobacteria bacterium]|nr:ZIP family metal transporter [Gammaproteobacteria bacterium]
MTLIYYKIIAALIIFLISITAAIYPLIKKKYAFKHAESVELGEALASGIFLGAAFFHMLPDAVEMFEHIYGTLSYPLPEAICILSFLLLLFLERLSLGNHGISSRNSIPYILALILIIHALIEGAALGIGSTLAETIMLLIAIAAHKGSESFALSVTMLRHELPFKRTLLIIVFFSLMTPLGITIGTIINQFTFVRSGELIAATFNAFAAGTFLYISTLHHVHFHHHTRDTQGLLEFASLVIGVAAMGLIAFWV